MIIFTAINNFLRWKLFDKLLTLQEAFKSFSFFFNTLVLSFFSIFPESFNAEQPKRAQLSKKEFPTTRAETIVGIRGSYFIWNAFSLAENHRLIRNARDWKCRDSFWLIVWVWESFGKCSAGKTAVFLSLSSSWCLGLFGIYVSSSSLYVFLSWTARFVPVNLHMIIKFGCLERDAHQKTSAWRRIVHHWCRLLFRFVIKCHYQVFSVFPPHIKVFVYCYLNGCFYIKMDFLLLLLFYRLATETLYSFSLSNNKAWLKLVS